MITLDTLMILGLFWLEATVGYLNNFIITSSVVTYYFGNIRNESRSAKVANVKKGWELAYLSHIGSCALGAAVIFPVRIMKFVIVYPMRAIESCCCPNENNAGGGRRGVMWCNLACFKACAGCLEPMGKCLRAVTDAFERVTDYVNEQAYEYIAVTGDSFCYGGR